MYPCATLFYVVYRRDMPKEKNIEYTGKDYQYRRCKFLSIPRISKHILGNRYIPYSQKIWWGIQFGGLVI